MPRFKIKPQPDCQPLSFCLNGAGFLRPVRNQVVDRTYLPDYWKHHQDAAKGQNELVVLPGVGRSADKWSLTLDRYHKLSKTVDVLPNPVVKIIGESVNNDPIKGIAARSDTSGLPLALPTVKKKDLRLDCVGCDYKDQSPCCLVAFSPTPSETIIRVKKKYLERPKMKAFDKNLSFSAKTPSRLSTVKAIRYPGITPYQAVHHLCEFGPIDELHRIGVRSFRIVYRNIADACKAIEWTNRDVVRVEWWNERMKRQCFNIEPEYDDDDDDASAVPSSKQVARKSSKQMMEDYFASDNLDTY